MKNGSKDILLTESRVMKSSFKRFPDVRNRSFLPPYLFIAITFNFLKALHSTCRYKSDVQITFPLTHKKQITHINS